MNLWQKINDHQRYFYFLVAVIVLLYLGHLGFYPLFNPDEGRYGEIPREMLASGNFITPHLNGVEYFEKPVLQYWFNAFFMCIFGENEFAVRLFPALTGLGGIFATYKLGQKMFNRATGILAAIILATSFLYLVIASLNILDMAVAFFITLGLTCYYFYYVSKKKRYLYTVYAAMALGLLTKGLIGIVLVGGVVYLFLLLRKEWGLLWKNISLIGLLIFAVITVPWFYLVCQANPDFFHFFFIHEHFQRYLTTVHQRYEPFWFFVPCLILGFAPWTAGFMTLKNKAKSALENKAPYLYLSIWTGLIFIFFSISDSKLVPYIVPCFPPLAIMMAAGLLKAEKFKGYVICSSVVNYLLALILAIAGVKLAGKGPNLAAIMPLVIVLVLGQSIVLYGYLKGKSKEQFISLLVIFSLASGFATWPLIAGTADYRTTKPVAQYLNTINSKEYTIIMYKDYFQDVPFYTKQRIMLADYKGELEFGSEHSSGQGWFIEQQEMLRRFQQGDVILVMDAKRLPELEEKLHLINPNLKIKIIGEYQKKYAVIAPKGE